jgi:Outer membrane protein beta-barrel domain
MTNEKNFYDILRSKFNSSELPFEEENWKSMKKMIDDSRAAKNRAIWYVASLGLLLFSGGAFGIYEWNSITGKSDTATSHNLPLTKSSANLTKAATTVSNSAISANSASPASEHNIHASNLNNNTIPADQVAPNQNRVAPLHDKGFTSRKHHLKSVSQRIVDNNSISSNDLQNTSEGSTNSVNTILNEDKSLDPISTSAQITATTGSTIQKTASSPANTINKITDSATLNESLPSRYSDEPFILQGKKNLFSVEAGFLWTGGWDYGSNTQGHGFNYVAGIGFLHYLKSKIFIKTGLQFSDFGNMSSAPYTSQRQSGNVVNDSVVTTKRLYYLTIPVQVEYYVGKNTIGGNKNTVGGGFSVSYLIGSSGSVTTYQQFDNYPPVNIQEYSHSATLKGYATWNTSIDLFYKRTFNRKFSMYVIGYYGLTDIKNNSFFATNLFERDKGLKILVSYNL